MLVSAFLKIIFKGKLDSSLANCKLLFIAHIPARWPILLFEFKDGKLFNSYVRSIPDLENLVLIKVSIPNTDCPHYVDTLSSPSGDPGNLHTFSWDKKYFILLVLK